MGTIYSTDISGSANFDIGMHSNTKSNKQLTIGHLADVKENRCDVQEVIRKENN